MLDILLECIPIIYEELSMMPSERPIRASPQLFAGRRQDCEGTVTDQTILLLLYMYGDTEVKFLPRIL